MTETDEKVTQSNGLETTEAAEDQGHAMNGGEDGTHYHHHHHHHHRHHHHSDKGFARFKRKIKRFFKKHKNLPAIIGGLLLLFGLTAAILFALVENKGEKKQGDPSGNGSSFGEAKVVFNLPDEPIRIVSDIAAEYPNMNSYSEKSGAMLGYWQKGQRQDYSLPVNIRFDVTTPTGSTITGIVLKVSENEDMKACRLFELSATKRSADVDLLKTNTKYYCTVTVSFSAHDPVTASGSFITDDTPRLISIEGISDVRDIGNWKTDDGRRIKQGLLYRGMAPYDLKQPNYRITDAGVFAMLTVLGIRTEMDLRAPEDDTGYDPLGASVEHIYYNSRQYTDVFEPYGFDITRQIFSDLAKEEKYPVYMHCMLGTDRTGTICCILEALLGVSEKDIKTDFELTLLAHSGLQRDLFEQLVSRLKYYEGDTLKQKAENFLLDCGVTMEEIASIRSIFLD